MSLTSILKDRDMKARFREHFPAPRVGFDSPMIAPPISDRCSLIGIAFDYLLRFHIKRIFPGSVQGKWAAETAVDLIKMNSGEYADVNGTIRPFDTSRPRSEQFCSEGEIVYVEEHSGAWADAVGPAEAALNGAKENYARFIRIGDVTDDLLKSILILAKLDPVYRAGMLFETDINTEYGGIEQDVVDLRSLLAIAVDSGRFKPKNSAFLNPDFGIGSALVGGADADLILDGALIDIKTTKKLKFTQAMYNQILGYCALSTLEKKFKIERMGIYFSRYGVLHTIPVGNIEDSAKEIIRWFWEYGGGKVGAHVPPTPDA